MPAHKDPTILMADDDEDDCMLARDAFEVSKAKASFICVEDGGGLMNYLAGSGESASGERRPLPALILLDLNMPGKDGRQTLREIKSSPEFRDIPIVILTTSREEKDKAFSLEMGANSFITKPNRFDQWVSIMNSLVDKWLKNRRFDQANPGPAV